MELSLRQQYLNYYVVAQNLILEISNHPQLLEDSNIKQRMMQLQECFTLPVTEGSVQFLARTISHLQQYIDKDKNIDENEGSQVGYTKVKKSGYAFIPVEENSKDIEVPNYNVPIPNKRSSLRQEPDYIFHDQPVRVSPILNDYNRGSSHVLMLALLTFIFETIFLVLAFFLYH